MSTTTAPRDRVDPAAEARTGPSGLPLVGAALRLRRRALALWALGLLAVVLMYLPLYPSLADSLDEQIAALPEGVAQAFGMGAMDPAGYTQATVFGLLAVVLLVVVATTGGARAVAAEEESGLLDLYLAHGVSRQRLLAERALQLALELALLASVVVVATLAVSPASGLGLTVAQVGAAGVGLFGLGLLTGVVALSVGAMTGSRAAALGAGALTAVGSYLADAVADIADLPWLKALSPFDWAYGFEPLRAGFDGGGSLLLLFGVAAVVYVAGALAFARRDIGV